VYFVQKGEVFVQKDKQESIAVAIKQAKTEPADKILVEPIFLQSCDLFDKQPAFTADIFQLDVLHTEPFCAFYILGICTDGK